MTDLIIQGPQNEYGGEIIDLYSQLPWVNKVVVSCWDNDFPFILDQEKVKVVKSILPSNKGIGNRNCHIVSSFNGLKQVKTEFAVKVRSDQKISLDSMNLMYERMMENPDKIGVLGFYKPFPFHPRDHSFWGRTSSLIELFDIPFDPSWHHVSNPVDAWPHPGFYSYQTRAESYIASNYLAKKDGRVQIMLENPSIYLWDFAPRWDKALEISEEVMPKYFFPMPRIDMEWPKHNLSSYPYDSCAASYGEYQAEN